MTDETSQTSGQELASHETSSVDTEEKDLIYQRILVPVDFSDHSKTTISYARRIALRDDSTGKCCKFVVEAKICVDDR